MKKTCGNFKKRMIPGTFTSVALVLVMVLLFSITAFAAGEEAAEETSRFYMTAWSLLPPVIAIGLALITKEVYTSLFVGIVVGGLLYSNFSFV